jgi:hypothetical protein
MATWVAYGLWKLNQLDAVDTDTVDFGASGDTIKIALVTSSYTPGANTHDFFDDVSANEVSGTNYTAGGYTLANKTLAHSSGTVTFGNTVNPSWSQHASGFSNARYAILYKSTGTGSTSALIAYADLGADVGNVAGNLTLSLTSSEIFSLT